MACFGNKSSNVLLLLHEEFSGFVNFVIIIGRSLAITVSLNADAIVFVDADADDNIILFRNCCVAFEMI